MRRCLFLQHSRLRAQVQSHVAKSGGLAICRHFGAEIIKVEPPRGGDPLRVWRELDVDGTSPWFRSLARNKKSVTIDMRKEEGRACVSDFLSNNTTITCNYRLVRRLAERSDIVVENFKPGSAHLGSSP